MLTNVAQITSTIEDIGHPASADVYARIQIESLGKVIDGLVENFIESLRWSDQQQFAVVMHLNQRWMAVAIRAGNGEMSLELVEQERCMWRDDPQCPPVSERIAT